MLVGYQPKMSLCVPVSVKGCGLYSDGKVPVSAKIEMTLRNLSSEQPRFMHFLNDFLNNVEYLTVYFIIQLDSSLIHPNH